VSIIIAYVKADGSSCCRLLLLLSVSLFLFDSDSKSKVHYYWVLSNILIYFYTKPNYITLAKFDNSSSYTNSEK